MALPPTQAELTPLDTEAVYGPIKDTLADEEGGSLTPDDMIAFVACAMADTGLTGYIKKNYNELVNVGIRKIVTDLFHIDTTTVNLRPNQNIDHFGIEVEFLDAEIQKPVGPTRGGQVTKLYPNHARCNGASYSAPLIMSAKVTLTAFHEGGRKETKSAKIAPFEVSQFPIMVGSSHCHTYNMTREALKQLEEDPNDTGGYFITKGEWAILLLENIRFNSLHVYLALQSKELVRGEFISQPPGSAFENSSQIIIRLHPSGLLTAEINSMKFQKLQIPFFLLFRLFGMVNDVEIIEQVVGDINSESPVDQQIIAIINKALHETSAPFESLKDELNQQVITEHLAAILESFVTNPKNYKKDPEAVKHLTNRLPTIMDKVFLPHVGQTKDSRERKLRFFGLLIHKTMLPHLGVMPPADRDSFVMKRVHGSGVSLAKAFKAMFNNAVVNMLVTSFRHELKQTDFEKIDTTRIQEAGRSIFTASTDLSRLMDQSITSGNKTIMVRRKPMKNRVASTALERKSQLNVVCSMRRIIAQNASSATKGTVRAELIRAVHDTSMGYVCPYHSADTGEQVGLEKQLACTATVCEAGVAYPLELRLAADPEVYDLTQVTNKEINQRDLCRIYVNGNWIGCCAEPEKFFKRYRGLRRQGLGVTPQTTIDWKLETNEIEFWLDVGRITRPLLIVDNNQEEFDAAARKAFAAKKAGNKDWKKHRVQFIQNVRFTKKHVEAILRGELTLQELVKKGICEYVTPEEMENCLLAESIDKLYACRHDVTRAYTHCDVAQALCGMAALVSPFANHTQAARVTYETNQGRSTCGWYSGAWPFRMDHLRFFQFFNQYPLVTTLASNFINPSGMNMQVAYAAWDGNGQEDSAIVNQGFIQRGGFAGFLFRRIIVSLEKGEQFGVPDPSTTSGMKANASYSKLVNGLVPAGEQLSNGEVAFGRIAKETSSASSGRRDARGVAAPSYIDRSVVYKFETGRVERVFKTLGPDDATMGVMKVAYWKDLNIGDKMSSREGNKSIVALVLSASELMYDEDGNRPDLFINMHSIPTRMVVGQNIEAYIGLSLAPRGVTSDGTPFRKIDLPQLSALMRRLGNRESGCRTMTNPRTGMPQERAIFMGPTYQQRLQKFVDLNGYAAPMSGPVDPLTGQPLEGKSAGGGLRLGEMEVWVLVALSVMRFLDSKLRADSDGRTGYYCRRCGGQADYNAALSIYNCPRCREFADIIEVPTSQSAIVLMHELRAAGINPLLVFPSRRFESSVPPLVKSA